MQWVEAMDDAKHPTVHKVSPTTQNSPAPNISSTTIEKPCVKSMANNYPQTHLPSLVTLFFSDHTDKLWT